MPDRQRNSYGAAVSSSPLFKIPLEIRSILYTYLLVCPEDIFVSADSFRRHRKKRITHECVGCDRCGIEFQSFEQCVRHKDLECSRTYKSIPPHSQVSKKHSSLHPSLIRSCRILHLEAVSILYRQNTFLFANASTANTFRWSADVEQTPHIQRIHIWLAPLTTYWPSSLRATKINRHDNEWLTYVAAARFSLANDFCRLTGLTLTLGKGLSISSAETITTIFEKLADKLPKLQWLQIIGLNDRSLLHLLKPVVQQKNQRQDAKDLQIQTSTWACRIGWTNALLWWALPGQSPPVEPISFTGDRRWRRRIYQLNVAGRVTYTCGESFGAEDVT